MTLVAPRYYGLAQPKPLEESGDMRPVKCKGVANFARSTPPFSLVVCCIAITTAFPDPLFAQSSELPTLGETKLESIVVRDRATTPVGPMPGLNVTREQIPGNVQSITAKQIQESHALSLGELMNSRLQSVTVNDYQGNPFQMDVQYRGFTASPQLGTPQGLSVFLDGIRVNEPFGDVVNWDLIPLNALVGIDVFPGSNPVFGLGTLGGALSMRTRSGFSDTGVSAEILGGSFGRKQLQVSAGGNNGTVAGFLALNLFKENGWRDNSPSKVNQAFGKVEWRNQRAQIGLSTLFASNDLIGNGLIPTEMYQQRAESVFSSPDQTKNKLMQFQLSGAFDVTDTFNVTTQIYRRSSKRRGLNGDIYEAYGEITDHVTRRPNPGERPVCLYPDINRDGIADYYIDTANLAVGADGSIVGVGTNANIALPGQAMETLSDENGNIIAQRPFWTSRYNTEGAIDTSTRNEALPTDYRSYVQRIWSDPRAADSASPFPSDEFGGLTAYYDGESNFYRGADGFRRTLVNLPVLNADDCLLPNGNPKVRNGVLVATDSDGNPLPRTADSGLPIAVLTKSSIDQISDGGAVQFNWNLDRHKFMVGASVDRGRAEYSTSQRLGLLDAERRAFLAPDQLGAQYFAASNDVVNSEFDGTTTTRSLYASETYTPVDNLHLSAAVRYNHTRLRNTLSARAAALNSGIFANLHTLRNLYPELGLLCPSDDVTQCATEPVPTSPSLFLSDLSSNRTSDRFTYRSLNPSFGASWLPRENLNLYANWSKGARTPSVIELGCAYDGTLVNDQGEVYDPHNPNHDMRQFVPRSLAGNAGVCTLPSTLSGDPYLPQVVSYSSELGVRGKLAEGIDWNFAVYRTNLKDDIYFVSLSPERSFFQTIGKTRREGVEMGITGSAGRSDFRLNYAMTSATFQTDAKLASQHNSSAGNDATIEGERTFEQIQVKPGNRMPGVPLHNVNASFGYRLTDNWRIGMTMIAHSWSYVRGNENNGHQAGSNPGQLDFRFNPDTGLTEKVLIPGKPWLYAGKVPGYAVFNLQTAYKFGHGLTLTAQINNLFDRQYYTAGRLGINPFTTSSTGAPIGASGWNYNATEWQSTNLIAPGAPRGIWVAMSYEFDGK